jgi:hypothetical protein
MHGTGRGRDAATVAWKEPWTSNDQLGQQILQRIFSITNGRNTGDLVRVAMACPKGTENYDLRRTKVGQHYRIS